MPGIKTLPLVFLLLVSSAPIAQADIRPVAVYTFNEQMQGIVRDTSGNGHHGFIRTELEYADAPGGSAAVFDGRFTSLEIKNHDSLVMSSELTIDAWLAFDTPPGSYVYIVDKGGERYSLRLSGDGTPGMGLKTADSRGDIGSGMLVPGQWHRVTAVFQRPRMTLYLDGEEVAHGTWDFDIAPGGNLYIGGQGGSTNFFSGKIDELRIYDRARPPLANEQPTTVVAGGPQMAQLQVKPTQDGMAVDTGLLAFEVTGEGVLRTVAVNDEQVLADNARPLFSASILESADYDGVRDFAPGRIIVGAYRGQPGEFSHDAEHFAARFSGEIDFGDGDGVTCEYTLSTTHGSRFLTISARFMPQGDFTNRFLRSLAINFPLALHQRKRVVQAGDRGLQWTTRHFYQFHLAPVMTLMPEPDHNIWRIFSTDQNTPHDFHIWRAESPATSPLSMQRGLAAPGWMAAYDAHNGVLFSYRGMTERAPKTLQVLAEGAGEGIVHLWSPTRSALAVNAPQAGAVFGEPHQVDLTAFNDEFRFAQPDRALAEHWQVPSLAGDGPARNEVPLADFKLFTAPANDAAAPMITGGLPFARGELQDPGNVCLLSDGAPLPAQTRALAYWPDRSVKWLQVTFPAEGGAVTGAVGGPRALEFAVNRRDDSERTYRLEYGDEAHAGEPVQRLTAREQAGQISLDTGVLQLELSAAEGWLGSARLHGRELLGEGGVHSFVDFLRTDDYGAGEANIPGRLDDGRFQPDSIVLEENGPLRATVRLEGLTGSQEPARLVVRLEAYAGKSTVRVQQSVIFRHLDPREAFVRRMGLTLQTLPGDAPQGLAGGLAEPMALTAGERCGLRQHSHLGYEQWHQKADERFPHIVHSANRSRGWLDLAGANGGVTVMLRNMWQEAPGELAAGADGALTAFLYPESLPPMDLRRYSNYPHLSQGESTPSHSNWVADNYYHNEPVVGIGKTHELLLYFHDAQPNATALDALAGDFQEPPLIWAGAQAYHDARVVLPPYTLSNPQQARMDANMDHFARFWMHQQKLWGWYGMWDYGDMQHFWRGGYGWILPPQTLKRLVAEQDFTSNMDSERITDYAAHHDWAFDNGRWGWGNTEGLPGLLLQTQYLRTGDRELYFLIEAMARHVRDVDMRHEGKWLGYGTRHGVQHWSDGNHEERQTTHSEFRYHHYLSGDMRSRDFAELLTDTVYTKREVAIHAAHSGRLQGLLTRWEMTGDPELGELLERYISAFIVPEGIAEQPRISFPGPQHSGFRDEVVNGGNMFFWTFGAGHGIFEYYYLTEHQPLKEALIQMADALIRRDNPAFAVRTIAFAANHAPDPQPYRDYLDGWAQRNRLLMLQMVPHNPEYHGGARAMLRTSVPGALFFMNDLLYMQTALAQDPVLNEEDRARVQQVDAEGGALSLEPSLSWQTEYDDIPELQEYLRIKHPQP